MRKKKSSPPWVDKLLNFRSEISEEDYREYWKRLNRIRKNRDEWNAEGQRIIRELEQEKEQPIFHAREYPSVSRAHGAAESYRRSHGGRIVRRDSSGRFSKRGRTFQVIRAKK